MMITQCSALTNKTIATCAHRQSSAIRVFASQGFYEQVSKNVKKTVAIGAATCLLLTGSAHADLDTDTFKSGVKATIESSNISDQSAHDVVKLLKDKVLPEVEAALSESAKGSGLPYPESIVQELRTISNEIDALDEQQEGGGDQSNVKSMASSIEQQINALKAILVFD